MTDTPTMDTEVQLAESLGRLLQQRRWSITTAESCTGGLIGAAITAVAGSSGWYEQGFVTYSNQAKSRLLGVPADLIERSGAVSEAVVAAMASGAKASAAATVGVAVSGVAGPGGGTPAKPVGTVWIAWDIDGEQVHTACRQFVGNREAVRRAAVIEALRVTIRLLEKPEKTT